MSGPGQVAIVTGGAAGIGAACARRLAASGRTVVVADLHEPEDAADGVRVVSVSPGVIATAMTADLPPAATDQVLRSVPLGRMGNPEDVAKLVMFLVSDDAAYLTGSDHPVDGGQLTQ